MMLGRNDFGVNDDPYATARQLIYAPPERRKTFVADLPSNTHYRVVSCAEAAAIGECKHYAEGFVVPVPPRDLEPMRALLTTRGYVYSEGDAPMHLAAAYPAGTRFFVFPPEQRCMGSYKVPHRIPLGYDPILSVREGDFRYFTGNDSVNLRPESWTDQLKNTLGEMQAETDKG